MIESALDSNAVRYTSPVRRIAIGIAAGILTISLLMAGKIFGFLLISAIFVLAIIEFLELMNPRPEKHIAGSLKFVFSAAFVTCMALLAAFQFAKPDRVDALGFYIFTVALSYMLVFFAASYLLVSNFPDSGFSLDQALYVFFGFGHLFIGLAAFALVYAFDTGHFWFLIFILSWGMDGGAFFTGKLFGKTPLAPLVSPKKTKEGMFGGMLTAAIATPWFFWATAASDAAPIGWITLIGYAFMGAFIAGFGHLGDLLMSVIKRISERKESGSFLPGHGGVLDKLDSLMPVSIAVAAFYIYAMF